MKRQLMALVSCLMLTAGCSSEYKPTPLPPSTAEQIQAPPDAPASEKCTPAAVTSYAPPSSVPTDLSDYPTVARIKASKIFTAGVSANSVLLGSRNPLTGKIEGFDIDMAKLIADAIFAGSSYNFKLQVMNSDQRIPALEKNEVDLVARSMTINCARWKSIAFSAEYYRSGQRLLVQSNSKATSLADLADQKVCAAAGTTNLALLQQNREVIAVPSANEVTCLIAFQRGEVAAITGDDVLMAGLASQDPYAKVVGKPFSVEPYGMGFNKNQPDLVRYANAVLAAAIADGRWAASYNRWLAPKLGPVSAPPRPVYGR